MSQLLSKSENEQVEALQAELESEQAKTLSVQSMETELADLTEKYVARGKELDRIKPAAQAVVDSSDLCTGLQVVSMSAFHKLKAALEKEK
jgi:hypothetical protein